MNSPSPKLKARLNLLIKHLLSGLYDGLLLLSVLFVAVGIVVLLNGGERASTLAVIPVVLLVSSYFYVFFWTRGGQTLGMRAWHLAIFDQQGKLPGLPASLIRYAVMLATLGLGVFWILFDSESRTLQDRLAGLHSRLIPKGK